VSDRDLHRLLARQLARHVRDGEAVPEELVRAIDLAYKQADSERTRLERSLALMSTELLARNAELVKALETERESRATVDKYQRSLAMLALILSEETDLSRALHRICEEVGRVTGSARTSVWMFDESGTTMSCHTMLETETGPFPAALATETYPSYFSAISSSRVIPIDDVSTDPITSEIKDHLRSRGVASMLNAPCRIAGRVVGLVSIASINALRTWSLDLQQFLASVADCVSLLLENQRRITAESARAKLEVDLRQQQRMESVGMLAGGVAHDFNNLLTPILANTEIVLAAMDPDHEDRELLDAVIQAAEAARDMVGQLLAFSRKQVLQLRVVDVHAEAEKLTRLLARTLPENITLELALGPEALAVRADPSQLHQVLLNLVVNAKDAMADGGTITIATSQVRERGIDLAVISVSDSGCGMPPDVQAKVFEPFFTTKPIGRGTGLGLSTVYGIVQQHGGTVDLTSEVGRGSRFDVRLPVAFDKPTERMRRTTLSPLTGETILVVEDEPMVRGVLKRLLDARGYRVIEAGNPAIAIELAKEHADISLVVTDVMMPGMNGRAMWEQITKLRPDARVMFISGYDNDVLAPHGVLSEGMTLVRKPFSSVELLRAVRAVLSGVPLDSASEDTNPGIVIGAVAER
jgi:signal transduction histidine kinase/ActR/RegA family two-component response regulator